MARFLHRVFCFGSCRASAWALAFFFLAGLISGAIASFRCGPEYISLMRVIPCGSVSIVRLYLLLLVPFLLSYASWVLDSVLLFPICFCRAFLFSFVHTGFCASYGPSGWLIRWLVLFSDCASLPLLYLFWCRRLKGREEKHAMDFFLLALLLLIGMVDYCMILPNCAAFLF